MTITTELVSNILDSRFEDLPEQVVAASKINILDTIAVMMAGSSDETIKHLAGIVKDWGGREDSTICILGGKVPAHNAALVNCAMARARDFGTIYPDVVIHPHTTIVPSLFTIAEYSQKFKNKNIGGKDFIVATTLCADIIYRMGKSIGKEFQTSGFGVQGFLPIVIAALGGKLLGFDQTNILDAMGIAYSQGMGNRQSYLEGALTIRLQDGFSGYTSILSTVLADEGFTGSRDMLEGKYGLYNLYVGEGSTPQVLLEGFKNRFEDSKVSIKPYPCCRSTHSPVYGILQLVQDHSILINNIKQVTILAATKEHQVCGTENRITPKTIPDAQFSYYYTIATALVKGTVSLEHFTEDAIRDSKVLETARKIKVIADPRIDNKYKNAVICPVDIDIEMMDGTHYKKYIEFPPGHPSNPASLDDIVQKFKGCANFSAKKNTDRNVDRIIKMTMDLENVDDITSILQYLS